MFKRDKKGDINEQMYTLIVNIVAIVIVFGIVFNHIESIRKNTLFDKAYLSRDLALLTNTIYSSPGNIFYNYPNSSNKIDITKFDISFKGGYVIVNEHPEGNEIKSSYTKELSFESSLPGLIETPEEIYFVKTDNTFSIGGIIWTEEGFEFSGGEFGGAGVTRTWTGEDNLVTYWSSTYNLNHISCPDIEIEEELSNQVIVIDPGHGDDPGDLPPKETPRHDPGLEFDKKKESSITVEIGWDRIALRKDFISTRDDERYISLQERKNSAENANIIISIHIGNYSNNHNSVKAFIPYKTNKYLESKKLACKILNAFLSEFKLDGVVIVSVDTSILPEEDPMQILNFEDKVAVLLEIGNINTEQGRNMFNEISKISTSITQGLTNYYSK